MFATGSPPNLGAQRFGVGGQFLGRAGLTDAGLSGQHHHSAVAGDRGVHGSLKARHFPLAANEYSACFSCLRHVIPALQFGRILHRSRDSPKSKTSVTLTGLLDNVGLEISGAQPRHRVELLGVEGFEEFGLGVDLVGELGQEFAQAVGRVGVAASGHR